MTSALYQWKDISWIFFFFRMGAVQEQEEKQETVQGSFQAFEQIKWFGCPIWAPFCYCARARRTLQAACKEKFFLAKADSDPKQN